MKTPPSTPTFTTTSLTWESEFRQKYLLLQPEGPANHQEASRGIRAAVGPLLQRESNFQKTQNVSDRAKHRSATHQGSNLMHESLLNLYNYF